MNAEIESAFVETFVAPNRRERSRHELASKGKRADFFNKLCNPFTLIDSKLATPIPKGIAYAPGLYAYLVKTIPGLGKECYVMSMGTSLDGKTLPVQEALEAVAFSGNPDIVIFGGGKFAYLGGHLGIGAPTSYILVAYAANHSLQGRRP